MSPAGQLARQVLPAAARRRLGQRRARARQVQGFTPGERVAATVALYFGDGTDQQFQVDQWLPVLGQLHGRHPVVVVTREVAAYDGIRAATTLPVLCAPSFVQLMDLYSTSRFALTLYVNNSRMNFQALTDRTCLHVHISHGESDKLSMASNRLKAYDRCFVAGEASVRRIMSNVLGVDEAKLVRVGRPQLDLPVDPVLPPTTRRTVLYTPTWPGDDALNNHTSVDVYGERLVDAVLAQDDARLVYRPHPRLPLAPDLAVRTSHERIVQRIETANRRDPGAGHRHDAVSDVLALIDAADLMVSDVSSVALDFLYRRTDAPLLLTDRHSDRERREASSALARAVPVVDATSADGIAALLADELVDDSRAGQRAWARDFYFDGLAKGESTARFLAAVDDVLAERERLLAVRQRHADDTARLLAGRTEKRAADRRTRRRVG